MKKYQITEDWHLPELEHYETEKIGLIKVRKYIKSWYEGWKDSVEENEYKMVSFKSDYKTYAICKVKRKSHLDTFYLEVKEKK